MFWFSGIFKEIQNGNQYISFRRIVCRTITTAWYSLVEYHLNFGTVDMLYEIVILIHKKYDIPSKVKEDWYSYIYSNQRSISNWLNDKIVEFLQKINSDIKSIENKLSKNL